MARAKKLTLSRRLFNPNFYHIVKEMRDIGRRFLWFIGGSSSAKSYSSTQAIIIQGCLIEGSNTLVFRKVSATIRKSIKKDYETIIKNLGLEAYFDVQDLRIKCYNGSYIDFSGLDDPEKIKGISSYKRVVLEEVTEFDFSDFKQIRKRLRGVEGQQIICTFNPIDEDHWIKTEVFDKHSPKPLPIYLNEDECVVRGLSPEYSTVTDKWEGNKVVVEGKTYKPNMVVCKSTYKNNFWVVGSPCKTFGFYDVQTLADFEDDRINNFDFYRIYALGEWGKLNKGGEMYKNFKVDKHTADLKYNPELSLHLSFDENVNPYMTLDIWQGDGNNVMQIDEICLKDPRNTLSETLKEFTNRYPNNGMTVFIYGDATSKKQDVKLEKGKNFYTLIINYLSDKGYIVQSRVRKSNPNVELRCNWIDTIFRTNLDEINITIDKKCVKTISDYKYLKQASDGRKHKERVKNPVTKVVYEKYGHNTDANEYFLCSYFESSFYGFTKPKTATRGKMAKRGIKKGY